MGSKGARKVACPTSVQKNRVGGLTTPRCTCQYDEAKTGAHTLKKIQEQKKSVAIIGWAYVEAALGKKA